MSTVTTRSPTSSATSIRHTKQNKKHPHLSSLLESKAAKRIWTSSRQPQRIREYTTRSLRGTWWCICILRSQEALRHIEMTRSTASFRQVPPLGVRMLIPGRRDPLKHINIKFTKNEPRGCESGNTQSLDLQFIIVVEKPFLEAKHIVFFQKIKKSSELPTGSSCGGTNIDSWRST